MIKLTEISNILNDCVADIFVKEELINELSLICLKEDVKKINDLADDIKYSDDLFVRLNYLYHFINGKVELFSIGGSGDDTTIIRKWTYHNLGKLFYKYNIPKVYNYVTRNGNVLWDKF